MRFFRRPKPKPKPATTADAASIVLRLWDEPIEPRGFLVTAYGVPPRPGETSSEYVARVNSVSVQELRALAELATRGE